MHLYQPLTRGSAARPRPPARVCACVRAGKEYAKADSRYATRDAFIVQMEGVTAFAWGPLCFLITWGILTRKAFRFSAMLVVSLGQLYGDVLYYLTCFHEGARMGARKACLGRHRGCPAAATRLMRAPLVQAWPNARRG